MNNDINIPKKITNQDVEEMIAGIQANYLLREGLCGVDLTQCDMSELDFEHFRLLCFDENTIFSEEQEKKFRIVELLESAKAPMKDILNLHNIGIDGKGIRVAIIDTNIDEEEFCRKHGSNFHYIRSDFAGEIEPHGATVLDSFLQTAPNAEVIFFPFDKTQKMSKSEHIIQYIKQIAKDGIKIISLSNSLENLVTDKDKLEEVKDFLESNGITLIDSHTFYQDFTYCFRYIDYNESKEKYRKCLCEPEDLQYKNMWNEIVSRYQQLLLEYDAKNTVELKNKLREAGQAYLLQLIEEFEPILDFEEFSDGYNSPLYFLKQRDKSREIINGKDRIEIPCGGRTLVGKYWGTSSASYTIPVVSGLFAMCRQVNPRITYENFVKICKETAQSVDGCNLIQPQMVIAKVKELKVQPIFVEGQIGKKTINTPVAEKQKANEQVRKDINFIDRILEGIPDGLTEIEKARYIYIQLGKYFSYDEQYIISSSQSKKIEIFNRNIDDIADDKVVCTSLSKIYEYLLHKAGIKAKTRFVKGERLGHAYTEVEIDGVKYRTDLIHDLMNIKTGFKTKHFMPVDEKNPSYSYLPEDKIKEIDDRIGYTFNRNVYGRICRKIKTRVRLAR